MKKPNGFWGKLKTPIYTLAPMADVTDAAFRKLVSIHGKPDVLFTEFVSCDGMCSVGRPKIEKILDYSESERPIVAQIFGKNPKTFYQTAQIIVDLGFDGIDINMGCPEKNICKQGAGASLIKEPELAQELIAETKRGAGKIPVSVKTRLGYNTNKIEQWATQLLEAKPDVLTVHLRTAKEMSKTKARWDQIDAVVELGKNSDTLIFGNGDVMTLEQADELVKEKKVDGIMFGRAVFGNPWLFDRNLGREDITVKKILDVMLEHSDLYEATFGDNKRFHILRKHLWAYASGFNGAKELRISLETTDNADDVRDVVGSFRKKYPAYI